MLSGVSLSERFGCKQGFLALLGMTIWVYQMPSVSA